MRIQLVSEISDIIDALAQCDAIRSDAVVARRSDPTIESCQTVLKECAKDIPVLFFNLEPSLHLSLDRRIDIFCIPVRPALEMVDGMDIMVQLVLDILDDPIERIIEFDNLTDNVVARDERIQNRQNVLAPFHLSSTYIWISMVFIM